MSRQKSLLMIAQTISGEAFLQLQFGEPAIKLLLVIIHIFFSTVKLENDCIKVCADMHLLGLGRATLFLAGLGWNYWPYWAQVELRPLILIYF